MNNVSFQGRTTLILAPERCEEIFKRTRLAGRNLSAKNRSHLANGTTYTATANATDIIVAVGGKDTGVLRHIPVVKDAEDAISELIEAVDVLRNKVKCKLTAWIIGGDKCDGVHGHKTIQRLNELAEELCDQPDIDTSILVGSKAGEDRFFLHPLAGKLEIGLQKNPKAIKNPNLSAEEKLENFFDIVELNNTTLAKD